MLRATCVAALLAVAQCTHHRAAFANPQEVDLLLVLGADTSFSVDERKFRLQRDGYAAAISDRRVVRAMTAGPMGRIALCFFEWADEQEQVVIVDWVAIAGESDANAVAQRIRGASRAYMARTSISAAIDFGLKQFARSPFRAPRAIIDLSGDGTNNAGRSVTGARNEALAAGVTINGIVVPTDSEKPADSMHTNPSGGLWAYYDSRVIGGPGAFVMEANNFEVFGKALIRKLIKEIAEGTNRKL